MLGKNYHELLMALPFTKGPRAGQCTYAKVVKDCAGECHHYRTACVGTEADMSMDVATFLKAAWKTEKAEGYGRERKGRGGEI